MNEYITVLKKYAVFSGRAKRKEYWMFILFNFIFSLVAFLIDLSIGLLTFPVFGLGLLSILYTLAVFVPNLAVSVRRLHDIGKSGWYYLIILIPIAGPIWFLVLMCLDSQSGDNKYGPNPKGEEASRNSIADYSKAIELAPDSADVYFNRADAYDELGEYGKAIADYNKAIEIDPNHASAYFNRGCAYGEIGAYDKAILDYNKAIELNPDNALAYYNRGLAYRKKGEVQKVVSDLERFIDLSTDSELIKEAKKALYEIKNFR